MKILASIAIRTMTLIEILLARFRFVVRTQMNLLFQLVTTMGKRTLKRRNLLIVKGFEEIWEEIMRDL